MIENKRFRYVEATDGVDEHIIDYSTEPHFEYYTLKGATDKLNELNNEKLKNECMLKRKSRKITDLANFNVELMEENKQLKAKVADTDVAVEVETSKIMEKIFDLIDEKANISHKNMEEWAFKDVPAATTREYYYSGMLDACRQLQNELKEELQG